MVNNIAQEDQEEPTVQAKILYIPYVSLCLLSFPASAVLKKRQKLRGGVQGLKTDER